MEENKVVISLSEYERLKAIETEFETSEINSLKKELGQMKETLGVYSERNREYERGLDKLARKSCEADTKLDIASKELTKVKEMLRHEQELNSKIKSKLKSNILFRFLFRCNN